MSLEERLATLPGKRLDDDTLGSLRDRIALPTRWARLLATYPLAGARLSLSEDDDVSGFGAEIQIMDAVEMVSEACDAYPGIVAVRLGYTPFGICLEGSGDPYFLRADGAVVRIPHDAVTSETLDESSVETVAASIDELLAKGAWYPPTAGPPG